MNLIIYTKRGCPWCDDALAYLDEKGIDYEEREVLGNRTYLDELVAKTGQSKTPTLDMGGFILADTDASTIAKHLEGKNLAKTL